MTIQWMVVGWMIIGMSMSVHAGDSLDWRNYQDADWTTPVGDQARYGHCWAFAAIGMVESQVKIARNNPDMDVDLSEQMLQSCVFDDTERWFMDAIFDFLRDEGTVDEACFPLVDVADPPPCSDKCADWADRLTLIDEWQWLFPPYEPPQNVTEMMKEALLSGPIGVRITVYSDLARDYETGIYVHTGGEMLGDHFVVLVGYNDTSGDPDQWYWIAKNSWGADWGEDGYFRIRMGTNEAGIEEQVARALIYPNAPVCDADGVTVSTSSDYVKPGDSFFVDAVICNTGNLPETVLFTAVLDVGIGTYWFYPSWVAFPPDTDASAMQLPLGETPVEVIPAFTWPDTGSSRLPDVRIYGAVLDTGFTEILGDIGVASFGYGP